MLDSEGSKAQRAVSNFVNGMGHKDQEFVDALMSDHRTLQQSTMRLFMACIKAWSEVEPAWCDLRNQDTIALAKLIVSATDGKDYLRHV